MQHPLRRITDRVVQTGASAYEQAGKGLTEVGRKGNEAARSASQYWKPRDGNVPSPAGSARIGGRQPGTAV